MIENGRPFFCTFDFEHVPTKNHLEIYHVFQKSLHTWRQMYCRGRRSCFDEPRSCIDKARSCIDDQCDTLFMPSNLFQAFKRSSESFVERGDDIVTLTRDSPVIDSIHVQGLLIVMTVAVDRRIDSASRLWLQALQVARSKLLGGSRSQAVLFFHK